jgi:hypothetical protein
MNLGTATILFASIIATLVSLPVSSPAPREVQVSHMASLQPDDGCAQQTWPNFSSSCLRYAKGSQRVEGVRPVTDSR